MTAKELRQKSFGSIKSETDKIEKQMVLASNMGHLKIYVDNISDAARQYFIDNGYQVKVALNTDQDEKKYSKDRWVISWLKQN